MTNDGADDRDEADDPVTRSMRSVWLAMRDEDPPTRGLADLMIAARKTAEDLQPKEPSWRRAFAFMWRPPVLALATVVVLVGGAVVLNTRSANLDMSARTSTPALAGPPRGADNADEQQPRTFEASGAGRAALAIATPDSESKPAPVIAEAPALPSPPMGERLVVPGKPTLRVQREVKPETGEAEPVLDGRAMKDKLANADVTATKLEGVEKSADSGGLVIASGEPAPNRPREPARDQVEPNLSPPPGDFQNDREAATQTASEGRSQNRRGSVEQLVMQAEVAAGRKDCPAVRVTVNRIKKLDATVYKIRIAKQAAIARCLK